MIKDVRTRLGRLAMVAAVLSTLWCFISEPIDHLLLQAASPGRFRRPRSDLITCA